MSSIFASSSAASLAASAAMEHAPYACMAHPPRQILVSALTHMLSCAVWMRLAPLHYHSVHLAHAPFGLLFAMPC